MSAIKTLAHFLEKRSSFLESISAQAARASATHSIKDSSPFALSAAALPGAQLTLQQLMACGAHIGHAPARWHPRMAPFIHGVRAGVHIIDLDKTIVALRHACRAVLALVASGGPRGDGGAVLWVGTSGGTRMQRLVYEAATTSGQFYVNTRWLGGTLTNRAQVLRNPDLLPDMLIVLDPVVNRAAVDEARIVGIPVVAICDTNCDPEPITYPIPANDDAHASVRIIASALLRAAVEGKRQRTAAPFGDVYDAGTSFLRAVPSLRQRPILRL